MAGNAYRLSKNYEKAKEAFEKASKGQEMLSSYAFLLNFVLMHNNVTNLCVSITYFFHN